MAVCSSYNIPFPVVSYIRTIWSKYESPQNRFFFRVNLLYRELLF
jgi:hypothetical protein